MEEWKLKNLEETTKLNQLNSRRKHNVAATCGVNNKAWNFHVFQL